MAQRIREREESGRMRYGDLPGDDDALHAGDVVLGGRYRIVGVLGRGGMATVYAAVHGERGVEVALKLLHAKAASRADVEYRLRNEVELVAELGDHPHIVRPLEAGRLRECDDLPFVISARACGRPLSRILASERALPAGRAARIGLDIARALRALHARRIVHRDVKPENIVVDDAGSREHARLVDFGLASREPSDAGAPRVTAVFERPGTTLYMSPEQASGAAARCAFDVFAWGVTMHEMLAGVAPLAGLAASELVARKLDPAEPAPSLHRLQLELPDALVELVDACTAREPGRRPSMVEVQAQLEHVLERLGASDDTLAPAATNEPTTETSAGEPLGSLRWRRVAVAAAILLACGPVGWWLLRPPASHVDEPVVAGTTAVDDGGDDAGAAVVPASAANVPTAGTSIRITAPSVGARPSDAAPSVAPPPASEPSVPAAAPAASTPPHDQRPSPPTDDPSGAACAALRAQTDAAEERGDFSAVLVGLRRKGCWLDKRAARRRQVAAHYQLGQFRRCAQLTERASDPETIAIGEMCRARAEATP
ncbi:MAG: serine/threonine protein kinase [Nannocystaceae bacterium]|nr:serine/threonine protein kinase [Deltaproteobacteria bacterium]MBP7291748.1 serine/threonine protein kinase [Nannocystaceae bacterium]